MFTKNRNVTSYRLSVVIFCCACYVPICHIVQYIPTVGHLSVIEEKSCPFVFSGSFYKLPVDRQAWLQLLYKKKKKKTLLLNEIVIISDVRLGHVATCFKPSFSFLRNLIFFLRKQINIMTWHCILWCDNSSLQYILNQHVFHYGHFAMILITTFFWSLYKL